MATGVTLYKSTDTSAPTLSGTAGDLVTLLDAILVNGYGTQPAAGWTKAFSGTNAAAYLAAGGNQFYLDVNDNGPGAGGAREARMRGYEAMTAVSTGTNPFPTVAQLAAGLVCRKSAALSATTRTWVAVADDRTLYLFVDPGDSLGYTGFMFGDFFSYLVNDGFRTMIIGRITENNATAAAETLDIASLSVTTTAGHYIARSYTQFGTSIAAGKQGDATNGAAILAASYDFPNPTDGSFLACPLYVSQTTFHNRRGKLRGFWQGQHSLSNFASGDTFSQDGKSFIILGRTYANASAYFLMETSDTWDTSV